MYVRLDLNSLCKLPAYAYAYASYGSCGNWTVTRPVCIISNKIPKWFSSPIPLQSSDTVVANILSVLFIKIQKPKSKTLEKKRAT